MTCQKQKTLLLKAEVYSTFVAVLLTLQSPALTNAEPTDVSADERARQTKQLIRCMIYSECKTCETFAFDEVRRLKLEDVAVQQLFNMLDDGELRERQSVPYWLGRFGETAAFSIPTLAPMLSNNNAAVSVAEGLAEFGPRARPALEKLYTCLKSEDPAVRLAAAKAILRIDRTMVSETAIDVLIETAREAESLFNVKAIAALGELGKRGRPALPDLLELTKSIYHAERTTALDAIGGIGITSPRIAQTLRACLRSRDAVTVIKASGAIWKTEGKQELADETIANVFSDKMSTLYSCREAADLLREMAIVMVISGDENGTIRELLERGQKVNDSATQLMCTIELLKFRKERKSAIREAIQVVKKARLSYFDVQGFCEEVSKYGDQSRIALPHLLTLSRSRHFPVRASAGIALVSIAPTDEKVGGAIRRLCDDPNPYVRTVAVGLVGRLIDGHTSEGETP